MNNEKSAESVCAEAIAKINSEMKSMKTDRYTAVIAKPVADALCSFCRQEAEFAEAIVQSGKTFADCCRKVVDGVSASLSDIEAYKRAVSFYFPGAGIDFAMTVDLCASVRRPEAEPTAATQPEKEAYMILTLDGLLDV